MTVVAIYEKKRAAIAAIEMKEREEGERESIAQISNY